MVNYKLNGGGVNYKIIIVVSYFYMYIREVSLVNTRLFCRPPMEVAR